MRTNSHGGLFNAAVLNAHLGKHAERKPGKSLLKGELEEGDHLSIVKNFGSPITLAC